MIFEPDDTPVAQDLRRDVMARRDYGVVYIELRRIASSVSADAVATAFVESLGLGGLSRWKHLDARAACDVASCVLHKDLAYSGAIMLADEATALATRFVDYCGSDATFLTNGDLGLGMSHWTPITGATFDTGVIAIARDRLGFLWVEDED